MRTLATTYALISAAVGALAQDTAARIVDDNAPGARYVARLEGAVSGRALGGSDAFGRGVTFHVELSGLPADAGPFDFHLHEAAVPEDGDCMGTGAHLDPYGRTASPPCDAWAPETCEVGDLSGKYGRLDGASGETSFHDLYTSLTVGHEAFFGDKSFVVRAADGSRIACANFEAVTEEEEERVEEGEEDQCAEEVEDVEDEEDDQCDEEEETDHEETVEDPDEECD